MKVGDRFETRKCGWCEVVEYTNSTDVVVRFDETPKYKSPATSSRLRDGGVNNPFKPCVSGVGFRGIGKYLSTKGGKITPEYEAWKGALQRCYNERSLGLHPSYLGCTVCEEWHNLQVFAEWYVNHKSYGLGYHLDKDILSKGNKQYSPQTCTLVPNEVNSVVRLWDSKIECFIAHGVRLRASGKYEVRATTIDGRVNLGAYETKEEAMEVFALAKERFVKNTALKFANRIEWRAYKALMEWTVYPKAA